VSPPQAVAFARQPILDAGDALAGYALLYRGPQAGADAATARIALGAMTEVGLTEATGGAPGFLPVTARFLLDLDPLPFGPEGVVLDLVDGELIDAALLDRLQRLRRAGYRIAVGDFRAGLAPGVEADELLAVARIARMDAAAGLLSGALGTAARGLDAFGFDGKLLAVGVETDEAHAACLDAGFDLFQGAFYCRPRPVDAQTLPEAAIGHLQLSAALNAAELDVDELEQAIVSDVGLSFRLLRLVNSAAFARRHRISSVRQAIVLLGMRTVRQWGMLLVLSEVAGRRVPLLTTALARARTCEQIAVTLGAPDPDAYFLTGLFSVLDALIGRPMEDVLGEVPVADDVIAALLQRAGGKGRALRMAEACEAADWEAGALPGLPPEQLAALAGEALVWADRTLGASVAEPAAALV
jgi:EAL and modified HD-GYP domain-containing signal transduction protein